MGGFVVVYRRDDTGTGSHPTYAVGNLGVQVIDFGRSVILAEVRTSDSESLPFPPLDLLHRTGCVGDDDPFDAYDRMGISLRRFVEDALPTDWTWTGRRVLDFGCGAGRVLRHFASEAADGEFWGCDIDGPSIEWFRRNLCPPFDPEHILQCSESPGLPQVDGYFDLIYAISVYTHLTDDWASWLLEHHRLLAEGGLLLVSFLGEGAIGKVVGEKWSDDGIGMNALKAGTPWDLGGPITLHSPWWLRAHWGRAFDVLVLKPGGEKPGSHGLILLQRKPVHVTVQDLERLEPEEPREVSALQHHVQQLRDETLQLRGAVDYLEHRISTTEDCEEKIGQLQDEMRRSTDQLAAIQTSMSWRLTAPLRVAVAALTQYRARTVRR